MFSFKVFMKKYWLLLILVLSGLFFSIRGSIFSENDLDRYIWTAFIGVTSSILASLIFYLWNQFLIEETVVKLLAKIQYNITDIAYYIYQLMRKNNYCTDLDDFNLNKKDNLKKLSENLELNISKITPQSTIQRPYIITKESYDEFLKDYNEIYKSFGMNLSVALPLIKDNGIIAKLTDYEESLKAFYFFLISPYIDQPAPGTFGNFWGRASCAIDKSLELYELLSKITKVS